MKKYIKLAAAAVLVFGMSFGFSAVAMADKLYGDKTEEIVTKGVTYSYEHRLTSDGWQNIYALDIDLTSDNVKIAPVESSTEYGLKETALKILNDSGAVAGVNADFFGLTGSYSASFGPVIADGELVSVGTDKNLSSKEFAAYFLDENGRSFIDYLKFQANFVNETGAKLELASINKITQMIYPIYFNSEAAPNTKDLDARFSGLVKLTVVNNMITNISQPGETVNCPEDGYLIIVKDSYATYAEQNFHVGDVVQTVISSSIDLDSIETAVGGGGRMLVNGAEVSDGTIIGGRQPRTGLGISQDQKHLILVVVDGRGTSIGATHSEMAQIMKEYGAYNAMHLDGGGSSTMVAETVDENSLSIKNNVSEGTPRRIMTALGVFNTSSTGALSQLKLTASADRAIVGQGVSLSVKGYDSYYNKVNVSANDVVYSAVGGNAYVSNGVLYCDEPGSVIVTASYGGVTAVDTVVFSNANTITPNVSMVTLAPGQTASFTFTAKDTEGYSLSVSNGITYTLSNNAIGSMNGNTFTATSNGTGYIECEKNGVKCYISVVVGGTLKTVESFEGSPAVSFSAYPTTVSGNAAYSSTASDGAKSLVLNYTMSSASTTQAAYANLSNPVVFNGSPTTITMSVKGNGTEQWVRGKIVDNNGKEYTVDFTKTLNWSGWKDVTASVPTGVAYPIKLKTIYVAALSNTNTATQSVAFDNIRAVVADSSVSKPADSIFTDRQNVGIVNKVEGSYYVTIGGATAVPSSANNYGSSLATVNAALSRNSDLAVLAGANSSAVSPSVQTLRYSNTYNFYNYNNDNLSIVQLTAKNGGLKSTQASQWQRFSNDINAAGNSNVIFIMDITPSNFSDSSETELMRTALGKLRDSGKNVYVVSASGTGSWNTVKDGIRYINLPNLFNSNGSVNTAYTTLTVKVDSTGMVYDISKVF